MRVLTVAPGDRGHGVVRHATAVAGEVRRTGCDVVVRHDLMPVTGFDVVHVHFTDALFGSDIASAARSFARWRSRVPVPVVVTLHDVPGHDPDQNRDRRRRAGYDDVVSCVDAVIVSSPHELRGAGTGATVIPLALDALPPPGPAPRWADRATVGVLGFVYPGKGHDAVISAVEPGQRVVAVGACSPGHEHLQEELCRRALTRGVDFVLTGPLTDADLHAAALAVTVPVAAYSTLGASASTATWMAVGRRPLVTPAPFVDGLGDGDVVIVDDLAAGITKALDDASCTWRTRPLPAQDTGSRHAEVFRSCLR